MKHLFSAFLLFLLLILFLSFGGCSGSRSPGLLQAESPSSPPDSLAGPESSFTEVLASHLALPEREQEETRDQAVARLEGWRQFEKEARQYKDANLRHWYYEGVYLDRDTWGVGLGNSISDLKSVTRLDPSFAEAWSALGRLSAAAGDLVKARENLDRARLAAQAREEVGRPVTHQDLLEIYRQRAWVLRDLGLWDEGLAAVREGLEFHPGDRDLVLIKGLLLAGAGRYEEATSLAVRMKPFSYRQHDLFHYGLKEQTSDYANRWIRSQALLAVGDYQMARHVFGELDSYPYRRSVPHQQRFWNDVGLVAELAGDPQAGTYYAIGFISGDYYGYYPWLAGSLGPLVLDVPRGDIPFFTSFGGRFHVGGSLLSYAAAQMNMMSLSIFDNQRSQAAWRARQALDVVERRNIRPDVVRAMRGRLFFSSQDLGPARRDLTAAAAGFREAGTVDPGTSLLLGLLEMQDKRFADAVPLLQEAVVADENLAVGWRSLGVSLVRLGRNEEALAAMDRSLQLEPRSVSGLYNRGLLHLQNREFAPAMVDLDRAFRLDPENHEVQRLLQMAAAGHRAAGGDQREIALMTGPPAQADAVQETAAPEEILAGLEADIQAFFAVPDSVRRLIGPEDQIIAGLERQWAAEEDPVVRRILALAYLDREMYADVQALLAPGWGVDLGPEEEIMLLYSDRVLGEEQRTRQLADMLLAGEASPSNPYLLLMLPREERKHWSETMLGRNHYFEGYGAARIMSLPDQERMKSMMLHGFQNLRLIVTDPETGAFIGEFPEPVFFRNLEDPGNQGSLSATSGGRSVGGSRQGNVVK